MDNQKHFKRFLQYLKSERQYSEDTITAYKISISEFIAFLDAVPEDVKSLIDVDAFDVESYLTQLYEHQYSRNSIAQKISALKSFYNFLVKNEVLKVNPFEYVHLKSHHRHLPRFFYQNEMRELFTAARKGPDDQLALRNTAVLELLYATGIRVSECSGIQLLDIDLDNRILLVTGKGNKQRYVPFGNHAREAILAYEQGARTPLMKKYGQNHSFLFVNHYGKPITPRGIEYIMNEIINQSSLTTGIHPHMLRHTFATEMLNNGADMRSVQELLGHSSLSTTQIYTHVTKSHLMKDYQKYFPRNNASLKSKD
ncbi:tyrosine recombinase XerC [Lentilactobacillus sp. IMAU92037]|nr:MULTISPECIES: tyrosine recombinase XerC [Lentilactobacillus]MBU9789016.1 tyrosine recombinase XerC [Lentilactobacillus dabitei]MBV0929784.1 tyrosine recombinase XerC [Lentilactobacillus dabitei]MDM7517373.1 tyrosine recombinase XerC [Lentilactobacillus sp. TOM.63]